MTTSVKGLLFTAFAIGLGTYLGSFMAVQFPPRRIGGGTTA